MIRVDLFQIQLLKKKVCKSFISKTKRLLEIVQGFEKFTHYILIYFSFCAFADLYIDKLINEAIQKGSFDVHLIY